jgi:hypothetical protein
MRVLRHWIRIAAVVAAFGSLTGCGDHCNCSSSSGATAVSPAQSDLARRIAQTQLLNGAWAFVGIWYEPIDYTLTGYQNTTGVSALGLLDAYKADMADDGVAEETWFAPSTLGRAKDFLIQWMTDFVNGMVNPAAEEPGALTGVIPTHVSMPNFVFCDRYDGLFGLTAGEASIMHAAFDLVLANRDAAYGTDPTVVADGNFNRVVQSRTAGGIPGLIGWDIAYYVRAMIAMGSAATEINWVVNAMKALPSLDTSLQHGLLSIAHVLTVLHLIGDNSMNATLLAAMQAERNPDGSYGSAPDDVQQTTVFCLMALKALGLTADAAATQTWLEGEIHVGGFVYDPATNIEVYEVEGEMLWSLIYLYP